MVSIMSHQLQKQMIKSRLKQNNQYNIRETCFSPQKTNMSDSSQIPVPVFVDKIFFLSDFIFNIYMITHHYVSYQPIYVMESIWIQQSPPKALLAHQLQSNSLQAPRVGHHSWKMWEKIQSGFECELIP